MHVQPRALGGRVLGCGMMGDNMGDLLTGSSTSHHKTTVRSGLHGGLGKSWYNTVDAPDVKLAGPGVLRDVSRTSTVFSCIAADLARF